jgi:hypothetical protein
MDRKFVASVVQIYVSTDYTLRKRTGPVTLGAFKRLSIIMQDERTIDIKGTLAPDN